MKVSSVWFLLFATFGMVVTQAATTRAAPMTFTNAAAFNTAVTGLSGVDSDVITFETFSGGAIIASGASTQGVTFTPTLESGFELAIRAIGGVSGINTLGTSDDSGTNVGQLALGESIAFTFAQPTNAFGLFVVVSSNFDFEAGDATLSAAGISVMNPVGLGGENCSSNCDALFLGIVDNMATFTTASIQLGTAGSNIGGTFFELDDLTFTTPQTTPPNPPTIPEPSTMLLFGSGLAGLAAWRYRKNREV